MSSILDRLKEPSSWASVAAIAGGFGLSVPDETIKYGAMALAGLAGLLGFFLKEKSQS